MIWDNSVIFVTVLVATCLAATGAESLTPRETVEMLTKKNIFLNNEGVIELLLDLDKSLKNGNDELKDLIPSKMPYPHQVLELIKTSKDKCDENGKFETIPYFEDTPLGRLIMFADLKQSMACMLSARNPKEELKNLNSQKSGYKVDKLAKAKNFTMQSRETLLDEFETRFKEAVEHLSDGVRTDAKTLSEHFKEINENPFDYNREELYYGSIEVVKRYLDSKSDFGEAKSKLFETCSEIQDKLGALLWILMLNNDETGRKLNLSEDEKRLISVTKICLHVPYNDLEQKIDSLTRLNRRVYVTLELKELARITGLLETFSIKSKDLIYKPDVIISDYDIDQALKKYLVKAQEEAMKSNRSASFDDTFQTMINLIEGQCKMLLEEYANFLYLIDKLKVYPSENEFGRYILGLTKFCNSAVTKPDGKISARRMEVLKQFKESKDSEFNEIIVEHEDLESKLMEQVKKYRKYSKMQAGVIGG